MEIIQDFKIKIGSEEYHRMISKIFEEKDKCSNTANFKDLLICFPTAIKAAENNQKYDFALVLRAHHIDNLYCSSGHAKSGQLHTKAKQLDKADEYAEETRKRYEEWRQEGLLEYPVHTAVWVYGYSTMIKLSLAEYGLAKTFMQKAQDDFDSLCSSKPSLVDHSFSINSTDLLITEALENNSLLEAAFLYNCLGQYHCEEYIRKTFLKPEPEKAITYLKLSQGMYDILAHKYGLFTLNIAYTGVYIVRTYLANQEKQDNWEVVVNAATLKDASIELNMAKQQNAYLKSTRTTAKQEWNQHTCRLDVLITFYQSFIYFKRALLPSTGQADRSQHLHAAEDGIKTFLNYDKLFSDSCNLEGLLTLISRLNIYEVEAEISTLSASQRIRKRSVHQGGLHQRPNIHNEKTPEDEGTTTTTDSGIVTTDTGTDLEGARTTHRKPMVRKLSVQEPSASPQKQMIRKRSIQEPYQPRPQSMEGCSTDTESATLRTRPMVRKRSVHQTQYVQLRPPSTEGPSTTDIGSHTEERRGVDTKAKTGNSGGQTHSDSHTDLSYPYHVQQHEATLGFGSIDTSSNETTSEEKDVTDYTRSKKG